MAFQNDDHRQIILGTLLGNGYLSKRRKNACLFMKHSVRHLPWLQSKAADLQMYQSKTSWNTYGTTHTWRSSCMPCFNELYDLCYPGGEKTITMTWLDQLRPLAIAVWYGDSGALVGRSGKNASLRTQSFGRKGNEIIEMYFNEVGVPCHMNKSRGSWIIVFTVSGTITLLSKLVAPHLPSNRYFKMVS